MDPAWFFHTRAKLVLVLLIVLTYFSVYLILNYQPPPPKPLQTEEIVLHQQKHPPDYDPYYQKEDSFQPSIASNKKLPFCVVIGVRKGGTRALIDMMGLNSKVRATRKEVHFFDVDENFKKGVEWYRQQMPYTQDDEISVEKTPSYFNTYSVPYRLRQSMPKNTLLLLVVRDPVTRLISDYTQILDNHQERNLSFRSFEELAFNVDGSVNTGYDAVNKSLYVVHMRLWLKHFPLSQFHIVNGDSFIRKPWSELMKVETFLGLEHEIKEEQFYFNASKGFHCVRQVGQQEKCLTKNKGRPHPSVSVQAVSRLRKFYAHYNLQFYDMVGQDFGWPDE